MTNITAVVEIYVSRLQPVHHSNGIDLFTQTIKDFRSEVQSLAGVEDEVFGGLKGLASANDWRRNILWLIAAGEHPATKYAPALIELLSLWQGAEQSEWITDLLGALRTSEAVPILARACSFDVAADPHSLAFHALEALYTIGTPEAVDAIRLQCSSAASEVRDRARELLGTSPA